MQISFPGETYRLIGKPITAVRPNTTFNRIAFAAAHVVADPRSGSDPTSIAAIDWDKTLAYRAYLLDLGFNIAEAMDTSQRGMGLDWPNALELIERSVAVAGKNSDRIYSGMGTDHLAPSDAVSVADVERAYLTQLEAIQKRGGRMIMMASRALTRAAKSPEDYLRVYSNVLSRADHPVILHWLGDMFDPALAGYWGSKNVDQAMDTCLACIEANTRKVDGIKISLLDDAQEIRMRRRLPASVKMYTGDDFNYPDLIAGDEKGFSHALLGIFDAIAPAASQALASLAKGDRKSYDALLAPTVPLSRLIFKAPTRHYKTGVVFLAWLNGHQDHFVMINGAQSSRALPDLINIFKLADQAGLLRDPDVATSRMQTLLKLYGC
jgi:hypothetical protein